jgi:hypothetical protein
MGAAGAALIAGAAEPRHLVLQQVRGDEQAQLDGQAIERVVHQGEQLIAVHAQLNLPVGGRRRGRAAGRVPLVTDTPLRIGPSQGGSSSLKGLSVRPV